MKPFKKVLGTDCPAIFCAGLFIFVGGLTACTRSSKSYGDQVVVQVNDHKLTAKEFAKDLAFRLKSLDALSVKSDKIVTDSKQGVIHSFIVKSLSQDWSKANKVSVHDKDLDNYINKIRSNYPDDLAFRRALAEQGIAYAEWREKTRSMLLQKQIMAQLDKKAPAPSDDELLKYYKQHENLFKKKDSVKIQQIVLKSESDAKQVEDQLHKGKKMDDLAKEFSITPEADSGGIVGWVEKGTLPVFDKVFSFKVGQRSPILKSPYGYHIIKVLGKKKARTLQFTDVKDQIRRRFLQKGEQGLYLAWLENQLRKATVKQDKKLIAHIVVETRSEE